MLTAFGPQNPVSLTFFVSPRSAMLSAAMLIALLNGIARRLDKARMARVPA